MSKKLEAAMREVHTNVPKNVEKTGKTGAAKEAMLRAIAFSKAGESKDHNPGNPGHERPFPVSKSYDVYGGHAGEGTSGVIESQSDGQSRALPPSQAVETAKVEAGAAVRCAKVQTGENRLPMNSHVRDHKEFGPNN